MMPGSFKVSRFTRITRVHRVDVYVHWSVFLIGAVMLLGTLRKPLATVVGLAAYLSVLIIHEAGHLIMARRMGYDALSIELYPFFGIARFERPGSRFDRAAIAWGGVLAQAAVAAPLVVCVAVLGYTPFEPLNAVLVILGGLSLVIAAVNLLPLYPLDGSVAWDVIPAFIELRQIRKSRRVLPYRSSR
jgi:Zn-dependent protease